jgi:hypothetical protein
MIHASFLRHANVRNSSLTSINWSTADQASKFPGRGKAAQAPLAVAALSPKISIETLRPENEIGRKRLAVRLARDGER